MYVIKHKNGEYLAQSIPSYAENPFWFTPNKNSNEVIFFSSIKRAKTVFKEVLGCETYGFKNEAKNCKIIKIELHDRFVEI